MGKGEAFVIASLCFSLFEGSSSTKGANPLGIEVELERAIFVEGASSGVGSLNMAIFEVDPEGVAPEADATLLLLPGCLIVDPTIFLVSGTFSLIRVFRDPSSFHSFVEAAASSDVSALSPVGSTNIWRRLFD